MNTKISGDRSIASMDEQDDDEMMVLDKEMLRAIAGGGDSTTTTTTTITGTLIGITGGGDPDNPEPQYAWSAYNAWGQDPANAYS